jgi:hypothetical protein
VLDLSLGDGRASLGEVISELPMPLNHLAGEHLDGYDPVYRVVAPSKYAEQTRLTTIVEEMRGKKFQRKVKVQRSIWEAALRHAQLAFYSAGADPGRLAYDCIVQEYPRTGMVVFIFNATVLGEERYVLAPFKLGHEQIADLTVRNLWQPYTLNS